MEIEKLTIGSLIGSEFEFEGTKNVLIIGGTGTVTLERKLRGSKQFYPLSTNVNGGIAEFELNGGCAYNGTLAETGTEATYRFVADLEEGEVEIMISRTAR